MRSGFSVELDELDRIVSRLSGLAGFISEHLDEIDDKVATLAGTEWSGVASQAYSEAHQQWVAGARDLAEGISDISKAARTAHDEYTGAIERNRRLLQGR
ncbi:WXG100 family type VII secretion target [Nocardia thailandica]|uniref:WXG100 family type VII secretion target n=1 Tax=Nocardia thailandica TaxID=257275 RepID=UPI0002E21983|nr:WXG100 family type VII secretion target [Nocardia thailandica]